MQDMTIRPVVGSARELANFVPEGFGKRILFSSEKMTAILAGFRPGQEIPVHAPELDLIVSVLDGDGRIRIGDEVFDVRAGDLATIPAGEVRSIKAGPAGMVVLNLASPPPIEADHQTGRTDLIWPDTTPHGSRVTEAVKSEHAHIRPSIEGMGDLADQLAGLDAADRSRRLAEVLGFLRDGLMPHAKAEEITIYPAAERVLRARGGAVATMTLGHERIAALIEDLGAAAADDAVDRLPGILHSLRAIVLLHLDEEEQVYLPALAGLSADESDSLARALGIEAQV